MTNCIQILHQISLDLKQHHWNTKLDTEHRALGEAYDALTPMIDTIAETIVAISGPIPAYTLMKVPSCGIKDLPKDIKAAASHLREYYPKHEDLKNIAADMDSIANKLTYKLNLS